MRGIEIRTRAINALSVENNADPRLSLGHLFGEKSEGAVAVGICERIGAVGAAPIDFPFAAIHLGDEEYELS